MNALLWELSRAEEWDIRGQYVEWGTLYMENCLAADDVYARMGMEYYHNFFYSPYVSAHTARELFWEYIGFGLYYGNLN